jgi:hypothetical protein
MLHLATHWPQQARSKFWPQAINYSTWVFNRLPNVESGLTPNELWSSVQNTGNKLAHTHVFGCPVYVLDATIQDGRKILKWNPRARLGLFLGFSERHLSQVPLVLNVGTGKISPQYHVIFDDKFETVHSLPYIATLNKQWRTVLRLGYECFLDVDFDDNCNPKVATMLDLIKAYSKEKSKRQDKIEPITAIDREDYGRNNGQIKFQEEIPLILPPTILLPLFNETQVPGGDFPNHQNTDKDEKIEKELQQKVSTRPKQNVGMYKDRPAKIRRLPIEGEEYELAFTIDVISDWEHPIPVISNTRRIAKDFHPNQKSQKGFLAECYLLQNAWFEDPTCVFQLRDHLKLDTFDGGQGVYFNDIANPRILEARKTQGSKYSVDNPLFDTAMRGPFQAEFWQAMRVKLHTLIKEFDCWDYVLNPKKNVLPSTWAFKIKQYPDRQVKKFKACFCARGDRQKEGIDYFETWAPVVMWSTVQIVMVLTAKLKLIFVQCDITAAFIHGRVPVTETIYINQPRGFHHGNGDKVLRLKRTLYGLKQSP